MWSGSEGAVCSALSVCVFIAGNRRDERVEDNWRPSDYSLVRVVAVDPYSHPCR